MNAQVGQIIQLDSSKSTDTQKHGLTYSWTFLSAPAGSNAAVSDPSLPTPTFAADAEGTYVIGLVVASGAQKSAQAQITITVSGTCFTIPQTIGDAKQGERVAVVAATYASPCDSAQADFRWALVAKPAGSVATVEAEGFDPALVPDAAGAYTLQYSVRYGGGAWSAPHLIAVTVASCAPVAVISLQTSTSSTFDSLQGTSAASTSPCGHVITDSRWRVVSQPVEGSIELFTGNAASRDTAVSGTFGGYASVPGVYGIGLVVTDDHALTSKEVTVPVTVIDPVAATASSIYGGPSLSLDGGTTAVAYWDASRKAVIYATLDPVHGNWSSEVVQTSATLTADAHPALFTSNQKVRIAYYDASDSNLWLQTRDAAGWSSTRVSLSTSAVTGAISVALSTAGLPRVLYNSAVGALSLASCSTADCSGITTNVPLAPTGFGSATNAIGQLTLTSADLPRIGAVYTIGTANELVYLACSNATCSAPPTIGVVDASGIYLSEATFSFALDGSGNPRFLFNHAAPLFLEYASCDGNCSAGGTFTWPAADLHILNALGIGDRLVLHALASGTVKAIWDTRRTINVGTLASGATSWSFQAISHNSIDDAYSPPLGASSRIDANGNIAIAYDSRYSDNQVSYVVLGTSPASPQ